MKKIIAFSLWGNNPKYCVGAIRNAQLAKTIFPEWVCIFYYNNTVPSTYIKILSEFDNVELVQITDGSFGAFWRFFDMLEDTIVISRDCDSRLSEREKRIVDDWLLSKEKMCVIRDHLNHYEFPMLAGMWGIKNGLHIDLHKPMDQYWYTHSYLVDQFYLRDVVWPVLKDNCKIYGIKETAWMRETYKSIGMNFIGQTYSENELPVYPGSLL